MNNNNNIDSKAHRILKMREESGYKGLTIDDIFASHGMSAVNSRTRAVKPARISNPVSR